MGAVVLGAPNRATAADAAAQPRAAVRHSVTLAVSDREGVADALVARAEEAGGYFTLRDDESLALKVPVEKVEAVEQAAVAAGTVLDRERTTEDLGFQLDQSRAQLASKQDVLARFREVLRQAGSEGVVAVEKEMMRVVAEIEALKGSIRLLEHRLRYAELSISFRFRDRSIRPAGSRSSFPWLNTVSLPALMEDFDRGQK